MGVLDAGVPLGCKDTNFSANHNGLIAYSKNSTGVPLGCKDTNFSANHKNFS